MHILVQLEKKSEVDCLFEKLLKRDHPKNSDSSCKPDSRKTMHESLPSFVYLSLGNESEKVEQNIRKTWESDVTEECKQYQSFRHDYDLFTWETSSYILYESPNFEQISYLIFLIVGYAWQVTEGESTEYILDEDESPLAILMSQPNDRGEHKLYLNVISKVDNSISRGHSF